MVDQKAEDEKIGGNAIRNASLTTMKSKSRGSAAVRASESADDVEIVQSMVPPLPHAVLAPSTPMAPFVLGSDPIRDRSPPDDFSAPVDDDDSDIECTGYKAAPEKTITVPVKIETEPVSATIPASTPANGKAKKLLTPFASIPRDSKTSKKRVKQEGSDDENVPLRSTKRVRTGQSFDLQAFLLEERQHWEKFQRQMLQQMAQSSDDYRKSTDDTGKFQNNFLTLLERTFEPKN
jgi:hypothetical protein